jgi:hypothetical protein
MSLPYGPRTSEAVPTHVWRKPSAFRYSNGALAQPPSPRLEKLLFTISSTSSLSPTPPLLQAFSRFSQNWNVPSFPESFPPHSPPDRPAPLSIASSSELLEVKSSISPTQTLHFRQWPLPPRIRPKLREQRSQQPSQHRPQPPASRPCGRAQRKSRATIARAISPLSAKRLPEIRRRNHPHEKDSSPCHTRSSCDCRADLAPKPNHSYTLQGGKLFPILFPGPLSLSHVASPQPVLCATFDSGRPGLDNCNPSYRPTYPIPTPIHPQVKHSRALKYG